MAENGTSSEKRPYSPGVLMVFGLGLLVLAAWCGKDFFFPPESWVKSEESGKIWTNGVALAVFGIAGLYCLGLAGVRSRKGTGEAAAGAPSSDADAPPTDQGETPTEPGGNPDEKPPAAGT